mmetsp:Transcript_11654/g.23691  ORF Transcript_11654/g.23691 Transcript_11654/m.23691 type:complete len:355 (-) Transcript_11654:1488-2552(-)
MEDQAVVTLRNGEKMPVIGLGTWKSPVGKTGDAVKAAIRAGYRMLDVANDYGNENEIGSALRELIESGEISRKDLFVQAKLWNSNHRREHVRLDLEATLRDLQMDYVDSFVIHWPHACPAAGDLRLATGGNHAAPAEERSMFPLDSSGLYCSDLSSHYDETWAAMEDLVDAGLCRTIGISNFNIKQIHEIVRYSKKYLPSVLQNECHPYLQQKDLMDVCRHQGIVFQSYSPLGSADRPWAKPGDPEVLHDPTLSAIASRVGRSVAQVVLRWHIQRGGTVVAKSVTPTRIEENFKILDFQLTQDDMESISLLNRGWRHLLWPETSGHPDYPFKDELPHNYVVAPAPRSTQISSRP